MLTTWQYKGDRTFTYAYSEKRLVAPEHIRDVFNDNAYEYRAKAGEFEQYAIYQSAASEQSGQPYGTSSEVVIYHNAFAFVAEVHMFVPPDSSNDADPDLGASGKADPKELIHEDTVYYVAQRPKKPRFLRGRGM